MDDAGTTEDKKDNKKDPPWYTRLGKFLSHLFFPADKEEKKPKQAFFYRDHKINEWETEFFTDIAAHITNCKEEIERLKQLIYILNKESGDLNNVEAEPLKTIQANITAINNEIDANQKLITVLETTRQSGLAQIKSKYEQARQQFLEGFMLGDWYDKYGLGAQKN